MTIRDFERIFPDEEACKLFFAELRWPEYVVCPRCGNAEVKPHARSFHWVCYACIPGNNYRFSVLVGTIFENSKVDLRQWFRVIHLMLTSKKGISALQVHRYMGFGSYATAWYMCRRIRAGLSNEGFRKLMGIVEVDETSTAVRRRTATSRAVTAPDAAPSDRADARSYHVIESVTGDILKRSCAARCPVGLRPIERHLWQPPNDTGTTG
jgi:transposase-like protein